MWQAGSHFQRSDSSGLQLRFKIFVSNKRWQVSRWCHRFWYGTTFQELLFHGEIGQAGKSAPPPPRERQRLLILWLSVHKREAVFSGSREDCTTLSLQQAACSYACTLLETLLICPLKQGCASKGLGGVGESGRCFQIILFSEIPMRIKRDFQKHHAWDIQSI